MLLKVIGLAVLVGNEMLKSFDDALKGVLATTILAAMFWSLQYLFFDVRHRLSDVEYRMQKSEHAATAAELKRFMQVTDEYWSKGWMSEGEIGRQAAAHFANLLPQVTRNSKNVIGFQEAIQWSVKSKETLEYEASYLDGTFVTQGFLLELKSTMVLFLEDYLRDIDKFEKLLMDWDNIPPESREKRLLDYAFVLLDKKGMSAKLNSISQSISFILIQESQDLDVEFNQLSQSNHDTQRYLILAIFVLVGSLLSIIVFIYFRFFKPKF